MSKRFRLNALLALLFCGAALAQPVAIEPQRHEGRTRASAYLDSCTLDPAKVLPPPPAPGTLAAEADLEAVRMAQAFRTPEQEAWARHADEDDPFQFAEVLGPWFAAKNLPQCEALFKRVIGDARAAYGRAKRLYDRPRPSKIDPAIRPCVVLPRSTSYPSGHSVRAFLTAGILADLVPGKREALIDRAHRAAWGRIIAGVHFPSDDVAGRLTAQAILEELRKSPAYRRDLEACRKEIGQAGGFR